MRQIPAHDIRAAGHAGVINYVSTSRPGSNFGAKPITRPYAESLTAAGLVIVSNFENAPERGYLIDLARARGVELELIGHAGEDDLVRLYNEARVVAYAPVREPFGLVPLEAMACGTPVVAVDEGGIPESVIDGRTGLLTDRDAGRFAAAIERLTTATASVSARS